MRTTISSKDLYNLLLSGDELALIDIREQGEFAVAHILAACCIPFSRFELLLPEMVYQKTTRIVLTGDQHSENYRLNQRALTLLDSYGFHNVSILDGGIEQWQQDGYCLFSGINTVSKGFGEFIEARYHTPYIEATALQQRIDHGENIIIFDARPADEYRRQSIPGAINLPGAELVYRFFEFVDNPETMVVVNCAGRTRSIIGAQSLINAGVPNQVVALKNGTMGWKLAGYDLATNCSHDLPFPSVEALSRAIACSRAIAKRFGVRHMARSKLSKIIQTGNRGNLYLLDVRTGEEFQAGHLSQSKHAPGGQLVQATDDFVAVKNAPLLLVDDNEIRATITASWLQQMGLSKVFVLEDGIAGMDLAACHQTPLATIDHTCPISAAELQILLNASPPLLLIDLATSREYASGHIPGAAWLIRSRMAVDLDCQRLPDHVVFTASEPALCNYAARDLKTLAPGTKISVLAGGTSSWIAQGYQLEKGLSHILSTANDVWYRPYERDQNTEAAMRDYLSWEIGLLEEIKRDGTVVFPGMQV